MARNDTRGAWNSKLGFILAASGSAIGLGNIVFFSSNAYQYGGGAFYLPYFLALFALGIPVMILKFGIGGLTGRALPAALGQLAGRRGEFLGWWALGSAFFITMYYIAILGWALGMMFGSFGGLFEAGTTAPFAPFTEPAGSPSATAYFFKLIASGWPLLFVVVIWALNVLMLAKGTRSIEWAVRLIVPVMWVFMIGLVVRGVTLDGGIDGVLYLFTPDLRGIAEPAVWRGAFSQMFFSLSLGLGAMTAYASYLPKDADHVSNSLLVSFLNCGFEYVAGIATFALLFAFALNPAGGTLTLSFFAIPQGIAALPWGTRVIGFLFFLLLVMAGLTSSISLVESQASALIDKLGIGRGRALAMVAVPGVLGSMMFALPQVIDAPLAGNGTLGLTLLDITDHWAFGYSLLTVGFITCIMIGWGGAYAKVRAAIDAYSGIRLGRWYDVLVRFVAPALLGTVIVWSLVDEVRSGRLYGYGDGLGGHAWLAAAVPAVWLLGSIGIAAFLTLRSGAPRRSPRLEPERTAVAESLHATS